MCVEVDCWIHVAGYVPPRAGKVHSYSSRRAVAAFDWLIRNVCERYCVVISFCIN